MSCVYPSVRRPLDCTVHSSAVRPNLPNRPSKTHKKQNNFTASTPSPTFCNNLSTSPAFVLQQHLRSTMNSEAASFYSTAVDSNVHGILKMQQGKYLEAMTWFHTGLMAVMNEKPVEFGPAMELLVFQTSEEQLNKKCHCGILRSVALEEDLPDVHDDVFSIFKRALHLPSEALCLSKSSELFGEILSGVLAYNIAIAHHLMGLQTGSSRCLTQGFEYYSMAYTTFAVQKKQSGIDALIDLGLLASTNNMGHILAFFRCFSETSVCSDDLSTRLAAMASSPENHVQSIMDEEYKVFFLNACFFRESVFIAAPSA